MCVAWDQCLCGVATDAGNGNFACHLFTGRNAPPTAAECQALDPKFTVAGDYQPFGALSCGSTYTLNNASGSTQSVYDPDWSYYEEVCPTTTRMSTTASTFLATSAPTTHTSITTSTTSTPTNCTPANGSYIISDYYNHRVMRWAVGATQGEIVAGGNGCSYPPTLKQLCKPTSSVIDQFGNYIVAEYGNTRIMKWAPCATQGEVVADGLGMPNAVTLDDTGAYIVADLGNDRIVKFSPDAPLSGQVVAGGNGRGNGLHQFNRPSDVKIDSTGSFIVADRFNHRIMKWIPGATQGEVVAGGTMGNGLNQLHKAHGVALDSVGNYIIADRNNDRIIRWVPGATQGMVAAGGNSFGNSLDQLLKPVGIAVDAADNYLIADQNNHRIMQWAPGAAQGEVMFGGSGSGTGLDKLNLPWGVAFVA